MSQNFYREEQMKPVKRSALTLFLAALSFVAAAHPHSFIRLQTQVVSENEQFVALKMRWTMEALTRRSAV